MEEERKNHLEDNYQRVIHKGEITDSVRNGVVADTLQLYYYQSLVDTEPKKTVQIQDQDEIFTLMELYNKLPKEGTIYMKLSSKSSCYKLTFFLEHKEVSKIEVYNDRIKCTNTAFLDDSYQGDEEMFVKQIKRLMGHEMLK